MQQISPYYLFYIKGTAKAKSNFDVDLKKAVDYLNKALEYKETEVAFNQLVIVFAKLHDADMYEKTILRAARAGFKVFYSSCGLFYANNKEKANEVLSLEWFNKGIEAKEPKAYSDLAKLYMTGCAAFKPDYDKAEKLLLKALALNDNKWNGYFAWSLGLLLYEKKMYKQAAQYYIKAIDYGYKDATFNLALMYRDGIGVKKDSEKYMEYLMMHLSKENTFEIAGVYLTNQFTPPDEDVAFMYFQYAASKGHPVAAIMCAAFLIDRKVNNEKLIENYLEIAFKNGMTDENLKNHYDQIEQELGIGVSHKLKELSEKYWNMRRGEA